MPNLVPLPEAESVARKTWLAHVGDQAAFNRELSVILADAAAEGERIILNTIGDGVGAEIRRAQYKIAVAQLQQLSTQMWAGQIDPLIAAHIAQSTDRAVDGLLAIDNLLARSLANPVLRESFLAAARNGADNVRSRILNNIALSPKVYHTQSLANKWVQQEINRGIALNRSAREIANSVKKFIRPDVRGGVSYAASRLGRTELNNAFHTTTIRASADQPWITGYKWHTSGSHPEPDECDEFADRDHDGLGRGIFEKGNAPGKPHPQCLCYITTISVSDEEFAESLVAGRYDKYLEGNGAPNFSGAVEKSINEEISNDAASLNAGKSGKINEDLRTGVRRWSSGTDDEFISQVAKSYEGVIPDRADVRALLEAVDLAPRTQTTLYRGLRLRDEQVQSFVDGLVEGKSVDFPVGSWSSEKSIADSFAHVSSPLDRSVVIEMQPSLRGTQGLRIDKVKGNVYPEQKEWIVQGESRVLSRETLPDGTIRIVMEQS